MEEGSGIATAESGIAGTADVGTAVGGMESTGASPPSQASPEPQYEFAEDWLNAIPEEYKSVFNQFKNPLDLANAYKNARAALGRRAEHFTENDWRLFSQANEKLNDIPTNMEDYRYEFSPDPENNLGVNFLEDEGELRSLQHLSKSMNLNRQQANILFDAYNQLVNHSHASATGQLEHIKSSALDSLKKEWGDNFENNVKYINNSTKVISEITGVKEESITQELKAINFNASPTIMKLLSRLGERVSDSSRPGYGTTGVSRASATMKYNEFKSDPGVQNILGNRFHPEFSRMSGELARLSKMAFGER